MPSRKVQFVLKVSKLCNLRCRYCYELEDLADTRRMSLESLTRLYEHVAGWSGSLPAPAEVEFVWHGGEPLLIPPDDYRRTFETQRRVFGSVGARPRNVIQTNLTVLDEERLELLATGFDGVGVSVDLFGGLRVTAGGRDTVRQVLENMDRLGARGVDYGAITVLSKANLGSVRKIIRFFHALEVASLRLLPLFDGAFDGQHASWDTSPEEIVAALQEALDELIVLDSPLRVQPLHRYVREVLHHHAGDSPSYYDKRRWEPIYVVDTNGDLFGYGDGYDGARRHGNLFEAPMSACVGSPGHRASIAAAEARVAAACSTCRFHGSCDGYPMAEEAARQTRRGRVRCEVARVMLEHVEQRLIGLGMIDPSVSGRRTASSRPWSTL